MSRFMQHEPCPVCGSRNNFGVWDDGHKFCFGCKHWEAGEVNLHKVMYPTPMKDAQLVDYPYDAQGDFFSIEALRWLYSCGIHSELQKKYSIQWSPRQQLVCWTIRNQEGKFLAWQGRTFSKEAKTKYVIHGKVHEDVCILGEDKGTIIVLCEDYMSAIRVSTHLPCMPLFGCTISLQHLQALSKRFSTVIVWLDADKLDNARKIASNASMAGLHGKVLYTPEDPKNYPDKDIKEALEVLL